MSKLSIFDHLDNLTTKKVPFDVTNDAQAKSYAPYMINRFVSMCELYLPIVNEVNRHELPKDVHYRFFEVLLPKRKQFFSYIKKKKEINQEEIKILCDYFECGPKEVNSYLEFIPDEELESLFKSHHMN